MQPWKNDMVRNQDSASWGEGAWNEILKCLNILGESIINWNNYLFRMKSKWNIRNITFPLALSLKIFLLTTGMDITSVAIKPSTAKKITKGLTNMTSTVVSAWHHSQLDNLIYLVSLQACYMTTVMNIVVDKDLVQFSSHCFSTTKNKVTKDVIKLFSFLTRGTSIRIFLYYHHLQICN